MSDNKTLLQKADVALADLAGGGLLNPEQSDRFLRTIIDSPTIMNVCRVVPMSSPVRKIDKIGFGTRIMRSAAADAPSGTALAQAKRAKPSFGQVTLTTQEVIAEVRIPYDVMEDNIERAITASNGNANAAQSGLHSTIVQLIGERCALDLEELALLGDTTLAGTDDYLGMFNGWLKLASAHQVNAGSAAISRALLKNGVKAMPDKYLRDRNSLLHFFSVDNETELRELYAARQTALGDAQAQGVSPLYIHGSRVAAVPLMPSSKGLYVNPNNLIFGIQRQVSVEFDKSITERQYIIVVTARVAVAIEETDAVVSYYGIAG